MTRRLLQSNRRNSAHSTGPKSLSGKAATARNAIKHGLAGTPEFSETEKARFNHVRGAFSELPDRPELHDNDIRDCAVSQVLLERTIALRFRAYMEDTRTVHELEKLVRFENRLTKQRDKLLKTLDVDEYADIDPEIWKDTI